MRIIIGQPSSMYCTIEPNEENELLNLKPRRYTRSQRKVEVLPFETRTDAGKMVDCGILCIASNGKLVIVNTTDEVGFNVESDDRAG